MILIVINHCIRLSHFPASWKEAKVVALPKPGKGPKIPQNLRPISLLPSTGKLSEKLFYKLSRSTLEEGTCLMQVNLASVHVTAQHCTATLHCGPHYPKLQHKDIYSCSILGY
jgi:hypothetical protein